MQHLLPLLLDWLSDAPDPDLGLLGLRSLATGPHRRDQLIALCRESAEAARQLCVLLGTGPPLPGSSSVTPTASPVWPMGARSSGAPGRELDERAAAALIWRTGSTARQHGLRHWSPAERLRIAARDVLGLDGVDATGTALTDLAEAVVATAVAEVDPQVPFAVIGDGPLRRVAAVLRQRPRRAVRLRQTPRAPARSPRPGRPRRRRRRCCGSSMARPRPTGLYTLDLDLRPRVGRARWPAASMPTPPTTGAGPRPGNAKRCSEAASWPATPRSVAASPKWRSSSCGVSPSVPSRGPRDPADEGPHRAGADPAGRGPPVPPQAGPGLALRHRVDRPAPAAATTASGPTGPSWPWRSWPGGGRSTRRRRRAGRRLPLLRSDPQPALPGPGRTWRRPPGHRSAPDPWPAAWERRPPTCARSTAG